MPRVDVTLTGTLPPQPATVTPATVARVASALPPSVRTGARVSPATISRSASVGAPTITAGGGDVWAARDAFTWSSVSALTATQIRDQITPTGAVGCLPDAVGPELGTVGRTTVNSVTTLSGTGINLYFENRDYRELLQVAAGTTGTVRFRNCRFYGKVVSGSTGTGNDYGMAHLVGNHTLNVIIEDSDLIPQNPTYKCNGVLGHHFTLRRCRLENNCDNVGLHNTSNNTQVGTCLIELCYFGAMKWTSGANDPNHSSDGSHTDQIEIQSGQSGVTIRGNYFYTFHNHAISDSPYSRLPGDTHNPKRATATLQLAPYNGASELRNVLFHKNYVHGGETGVQATNSRNGGNCGSFTSNVFAAGAEGVYSYHNSGTMPNILDFTADSSATISGNVMSNGTAADSYARFFT